MDRLSLGKGLTTQNERSAISSQQQQTAGVPEFPTAALSGLDFAVAEG
jgi:hypothetical protein